MIVAQVKQTLLARGLIPRGTRVLCGCSGGPDSSAMLSALHRLAPELGFELEIACVDHGLRPESAAELELVSRQAERFGLVFHRLKLRLEPGSALQARARQARYAALCACAAERGCDRVAVGHTRDDQAETVLMRLLRGAGVGGLRGIEPLRDDGVVRPLIDCERSKVHAFARECFRELVEDPSNRDTRFERVRIRTQVLPMLVREDPALPRHLAELADDARDQVAALWPLADRLLDEVGRGNQLRLGPLRSAPPAVVRLALSRWLEAELGSPPTRAHLTQLERTVRGGRGEVLLPEGHVAKITEAQMLALDRRDEANSV